MPIDEKAFKAGLAAYKKAMGTAGLSVFALELFVEKYEAAKGPACAECEGTGKVWHYEAGTRTGGKDCAKCNVPDQPVGIMPEGFMITEIIFEGIKHGDAEHEQWLKDNLQQYVERALATVLKRESSSLTDEDHVELVKLMADRMEATARAIGPGTYHIIGEKTTLAERALEAVKEMCDIRRRGSDDK